MRGEIRRGGVVCLLLSKSYVVEAATTLATTTNDWVNFISGQGEDGGGADTSLGHFLIIKENDFFVH